VNILNIMDSGCHEIRIGTFSAVLVVLLVAFFLFPQESSCEFYKYVDKDGKIHYVDSKAKIPSEYRKDLTSYEEKYDHLSEKEKQEKIAEDRRMLEQERKDKEELRRQQAGQLEEQRRREKMAEEGRLENQREAKLDEERREKERAERAEFMKNFETKVEVVGYGHVLVPCTLVYKGREVEAKLMLDTGCSITSLHDDVAKKLRLKTIEKYETRLAGGGTNKNKLSQLSYFKVGPYKLEDFYVGVVKFKGKKSQNDGLLGKNFLAGREYKIDYRNSVIRWVP
jgi:hypothetical protein